MPDSRWKLISIRTLCGEGDTTCSSSSVTAANFYPRPPRGGRPLKRADIRTILEFLSTPSARRATKPVRTEALKNGYFYPRPPRGGRHRRGHRRFGAGRISIHALREEGDCCLSMTSSAGKLFLSTPSARRATRGDPLQQVRRQNFYPRPPRGGRPSTWARPTSLSNFYPRPPRGGRLRIQTYFGGYKDISIHALREEGDVARFSLLDFVEGFLSTPSARRATTSTMCAAKLGYKFLSTPSARRATPGVLAGGGRLRISIHAELGTVTFRISIHALREEGDPILPYQSDLKTISIHALREEGDHPIFIW